MALDDVLYRLNTLSDRNLYTEKICTCLVNVSVVEVTSIDVK